MTESASPTPPRNVSATVIVLILVLAVVQQFIQPLADVVPQLEAANLDDWLTIALSLTTLALLVAHFARIRRRACWYAGIFFRVDSAPAGSEGQRLAASVAGTSLVLFFDTVVVYWTAAQGAMLLHSLLVQEINEVYLLTRLYTMGGLIAVAGVFLVVLLFALRPLFRHLRRVAEKARA